MTNTASYTASCLCSGIAFRITGPLGPLQLCHCRQCRKAQGAAFAANVPVARADVHFDRGTELISEYESSPGKKRAFCRRCGSPVYSRRDEIPDVLRVRSGLIDQPLGLTPQGHYFVADKADWYEPCDGLPRHDGTAPPR